MISKKGRKIRALREIVRRQQEHIAELESGLVIIGLIKKKFITIFVSSRKIWKLRSWSALNFFDWIKNLFKENGLFDQNELKLIFPERKKEEPRILTKKEKKGLLKRWRRRR